jgi:hypothetical protein
MANRTVPPFFAWTLLALCLGPMILTFLYAELARRSNVQDTWVRPLNVFYVTFVVALALHYIAMWRVIRSRRQKHS